MASRKVLLDVARFLDSPRALEFSDLPTEEIRRLATAFLESCYDDIGKSPRFLDDEDMRTILSTSLPTRLRPKDPSIDALGNLLEAYLEHLTETQVVPHAFELKRALDSALPELTALVSAGKNTSRAATPNPKPVVHRAPKLGRNEPCFCGSGKKFKKCHGKPG